MRTLDKNKRDKCGNNGSTVGESDKCKINKKETDDYGRLILAHKASLLNVIFF